MPWATTHHPPITFNSEGAAWQQSAFSKNVLGWSPWPIQHKKLPGGQREQQPGGVQHDQGEVYQKPITFSRVSQSGQVEIKIGYLYSYTLNLIPITLYTELDNVAP